MNAAGPTARWCGRWCVPRRHDSTQRTTTRATTRAKGLGAAWRPDLPDRGSVAPAIPIIAIMMFLLAGLVVDSARQLDARSRAEAFAQEAARAGAERINLNTQNAVIDPAAARAAVAQFCAAAAAAEPALVECAASTVDDHQVIVHTEIRMPATMLAAVGLQTLSAGGSGRATAEQGVTGPNSYPGVPAPTVSVTKVPLPVPIGTAEPSPTVTEPPLPTGSPTGPPTGAPTGPPATPPGPTTAAPTAGG